jgi:cation:H+ antiporter
MDERMTVDFAVQAFILVLSLCGLAVASHYTIKRIENLISFTGLRDVSAGFVILSVLTSMPEITVALFSAVQGTPGVSIGDILGSNVFNIGVVVGIIATLGYLRKCGTELLVDLTDILFLSSLIPLLLIVFGIASRAVGLILLGIFAVNVYVMMKKRAPSVDSGARLTLRSKLMTVLGIVAGVGIILVAARLAVFSAAQIAVDAGIAPIEIGAKIVAIGTSLPELSLDLTAARRGRIHLAIGDIIGSNLTNMTLVLGLLLVVSPFTVDITVFSQILPFVLITTLILWRYLTKGGISQTGGLILLMTYIVFQAIL